MTITSEILNLETPAATKNAAVTLSNSSNWVNASSSSPRTTNSGTIVKETEWSYAGDPDGRTKKLVTWAQTKIKPDDTSTPNVTVTIKITSMHRKYDDVLNKQTEGEVMAMAIWKYNSNSLPSDVELRVLVEEAFAEALRPFDGTSGVGSGTAITRGLIGATA